MLNSMGRPWPTADLWEYGSSWLGAWRWSDMTKWNGLTRKTTRFAIRLQHFKHHLILTAVKFINSMEMILANLRAWIRPVFPFFFFKFWLKQHVLIAKHHFLMTSWPQEPQLKNPKQFQGGNMQRVAQTFSTKFEVSISLAGGRQSGPKSKFFVFFAPPVYG